MGETGILTEADETMTAETEKLYYEDVDRRCFAARVLSCEPAAGGYSAVLDRTAFFPEGGGQPADTGVIGFADVADVHEKNGVIFHTVSRPLSAGANVLCGVNWDRRFRHMQQHTGEHIVSGIAHRLFGAENVGFHMGEKWITVDWSVPLDAGQLGTIERLANETVFRCLPVRTEFPDAERLAEMTYRSKKELTGRVRIVTIPGCDVCACCGTHVRNTGEVGLIKLTGAQNYKGGTRVTLVCGVQALEDYAEKLSGVSAVSELFSAKPEEIASAAERTLLENSELKRRLSAVRGELFQAQAAALPADCGFVCVFLRDTAPDDLRRCALLFSEHCGGAAAFSGTDGNIRYAAADTRSDIRPFGKALNEAFSGRGGGARELVQGSLRTAEAEIRRFCAEKGYPVVG